MMCFPRLLACALFCLGAATAAHAQQSSAAAPLMDTTGNVPVSGNTAAQQNRSVPFPERRDGTLPSTRELQDIHKNDRPKTPPEYARKTKAPETAMRPRPMPMKPPIPD